MSPKKSTNDAFGDLEKRLQASGQKASVNPKEEKKEYLSAHFEQADKFNQAESRKPQPLPKPEAQKVNLEHLEGLFVAVRKGSDSTGRITVRRSAKEKALVATFLEEMNDLVDEYNTQELSESKLYRCALLYLLTNHKSEFQYIIQKSLSPGKEAYDF